MKLKATLSLTLILLLASLLIVSACSQPTPAPSPAASPSPSASPAAPKPAAAPSSPAATPAAKAHEPVEIKLWGYTTGTGIYLLSFAQAKVVNKYSTWLRAEAQETAGSVKHIMDLIAKPENRKNTLIQSPVGTVMMAAQSKAPFPAKYDGLRAVMTFYESPQAMGTYNKDIKSYRDFAGKKVMYISKTSANGQMWETLFKDVWKIADQVKISYGSFDDCASALKDGVVDLSHQAINGLAGKYDLGPVSVKMSAEKPGWVMVGIPPEDVKKASEINLQAFYPVRILPGTIKGVTQTEPIDSMSACLEWWADQSMDPEVVSEFTRIVYQHVDEVREIFAGSYLTKDNIAYFDVPETLVHPGAVKFYKEAGVPIGMNAYNAKFKK